MFGERMTMNTQQHRVDKIQRFFLFRQMVLQDYFHKVSKYWRR